MAEKSASNDDVGGLVPILDPEFIKPPVSPVAGAATAAARGLRKDVSIGKPSVEKLEQYSLNRDQMIKESRKNGSMHFSPRNQDIPCGLINQGATCYLNSLLQSLFTTTEFREAVYAWRFDPQTHGEEKTCIPLQLQGLFARMELSVQCAVSTKTLTTAFGWTGADAFQQHDIQELTCLLLDALERTDRDHFHSVNKMLRGKSCEFIQPLEMSDPSQRHERSEEFIDIQVPVKGFASLGSALVNVVTAESLEGDNQWFCDELEQKVDATRGTAFTDLPQILTLHMMRFTFDPVSFRRVKVLDAMSFPQEIDLTFLLTSKQEDAGDEDALWYDLKSILMHSGSAERGHYYAFIKYKGKWTCFNDAHVHILDESEESRIFSESELTSSSSEDRQPDTEKESEEATPKDVLTTAHTSASNAYMLVYRRRQSVPSSVSADGVGIPDSLREAIAEENSKWQSLSECYHIHQQMVEIVVYPPCAILPVNDDSPIPRVSIFLHNSSTYSETLEQAKQACDASSEWRGSIENSATASLTMRLRRFNPHLRRAGETFGSCGDASLLSLGLTQHVTMIMEMREEGSEPWVEFNPNEMTLKLVTWLAETHEPGPILEVTVPGEHDASVGGARASAAKALSQGAEDRSVEELMALIRLVRIDNNQAAPLNDDTLSLRKQLNIWPGECLYVEVVASVDSESDVLRTFLSAQDSISILVNHIDAPFELFSVPMKRCNSLKMLKEEAVKLLGDLETCPVQLSVSDIHLRRGTAKGVMLKDESKTLHSLSFVDGSVVWLGRGAPCRPDQFMIDFVKYDPDGKPSFTPLVSLAISEKLKIREVKKLLSVSVDPPISDCQCIRLRDKKLTSADAILRDAATVRRSLMNLVDGRQVAVQVLDAPETVSADDIILSVRGFRTSAMKFLQKTEMVVSKSATLGQLHSALEGRFGGKLLSQSEELKDSFQIAKGLSNGPPLKASAALSLKWDDPKCFGDRDGLIGSAPISLRDGTLLYIRSLIDAAQAPDPAVKKQTAKKAVGASWVSTKSSTSRREPKLNITVAEKPVIGNDNNEPPAERLAKEIGVPLESAQFALEAAGGDIVLARQFIN